MPTGANFPFFAGQDIFAPNHLSSFLDKTRLQLHGTDAINLAVDIVITLNESNVFDLCADLNNRRRTFDLEVFYYRHRITIG